ncbi:proteasome regulatory particle base subunit [Tulasnella sp. 427]|nr:proteasome regulatory particle base subunit [Tulasnella sp. 427]
MRLSGPYLHSAGDGSGDGLGYLRDRLDEASSEVVQHGAALGFVITGMERGNADATETFGLLCDTAVAGEASGYAMGLLMWGSGSERYADEMLQYARETQYKKIICVYTLALANAGTGDNAAVKQLLHIAVSDTLDDRHFLLFKSPGHVPRLVQLLSESYNPGVRCGASLVLGLSRAGTGSSRPSPF